MAVAKVVANKGPRPITLDRLSKKQPIQRSVLIPATDEDAELLTQAQRDLERAQLLDIDLDKAKLAMKEAQSKVREDGLEFIFRGLGRKRFEELQRQYPPTAEQVAEHGESLSWDPDKFLPALLAATVTNSDLTAEQWDKDVLDSDDWGSSEVGLLLQTALAVNRENRVASLGN